jgi:hypothetical protein
MVDVANHGTSLVSQQQATATAQHACEGSLTQEMCLL